MSSIFQTPEFYEGAMLVCFGASWPFAIFKTIRAKNPMGKSFLFATLVIIGYIVGMVAKYMRGGADLVFFLYLIDLCMVATDTSFCIYYLRRNKKLSGQKQR